MALLKHIEIFTIINPTLKLLSASMINQSVRKVFPIQSPPSTVSPYIVSPYTVSPLYILPSIQSPPSTVSSSFLFVLKFSSDLLRNFILHHTRSGICGSSWRSGQRAHAYCVNGNLLAPMPMPGSRCLKPPSWHIQVPGMKLGYRAARTGTSPPISQWRSRELHCTCAL